MKTETKFFILFFVIITLIFTIFCIGLRIGEIETKKEFIDVFDKV